MARRNRPTFIKFGEVVYFFAYGSLYTLGFFIPLVRYATFAYSALSALVHGINATRHHVAIRNNEPTQVEHIDRYIKTKIKRARGAYSFCIHAFLMSFMYYADIQVALFTSIFGYVGTYAADYLLLNYFKNRSEHEMLYVEGPNLANELFKKKIQPVPHSSQTVIQEMFGHEPDYGNLYAVKPSAPPLEQHPQWHRAEPQPPAQQADQGFLSYFWPRQQPPPPYQGHPPDYYHQPGQQQGSPPPYPGNYHPQFYPPAQPPPYPGNYAHDYSPSAPPPDL